MPPSDPRRRALLLALAAAWPGALVAQPAPESPRLERLRQSIATGEGSDAFWRAVRAAGTPLVEPGADGKEALVTFLWRGTPQTRSVRLAWAMRSEGGFPLERMSGSDVWHLTLRLPRRMRASYQIVADPEVPPGADRIARARAEDAAARPDPLNPLPHWPPAPVRGPVSAEPTAPRSVLRLPGSLEEPWADAGDAPRGTLTHHRIASQVLDNERDVSFYLPPGAAHTALPLLVLFDREPYLDRVDVPALLDALIAQRRIPPMAAVFVGHPAPALRGKELPAHEGFADFMARELMPWLRARWPAVSTAPRDVVAAGSSYGGLAAAWLAYRHPQVFGSVLALSGSFWWGPDNVPRQPGFDRWGEGEWLTRRFAASERLPLRFFITAGLMEITLTGDGGGILDTSRHLRTVLQAKGYPVHYREFPGGHDYYAWRGELAQGLVALLGTP